MDSTADTVAGLRQKLRVLYAYSELNQTRLAERIGRSVQTLTGWMNGTQKSRPDHVPRAGREALARVVAEVTRGRISVDEALELWAGPLEAFERAFAASRHVDLIDLLADADRSDLMTYLPGGVASRNLVHFFDVAPGASPTARAQLGDLFAFSVVGPPGAQLVLLAESAVGCHLGVPNPNADGLLDGAGRARLPMAPNAYRFDPPAGPHRFLLFAIEAARPPSILSRSGLVTPLTSQDLSVFGAELRDGARTRAWAYDQLLVEVSG